MIDKAKNDTRAESTLIPSVHLCKYKTRVFWKCLKNKLKFVSHPSMARDRTRHWGIPPPPLWPMNWTLSITARRQSRDNTIQVLSSSRNSVAVLKMGSRLVWELKMKIGSELRVHWQSLGKIQSVYESSKAPTLHVGFLVRSMLRRRGRRRGRPNLAGKSASHSNATDRSPAGSEG